MYASCLKFYSKISKLWKDTRRREKKISNTVDDKKFVTTRGCDLLAF